MYTDIIRAVAEEKSPLVPDSTPQVGMFWWNPKKERFVLTVKISVDNISIDDNCEGTLNFSFEDVWRRHRMRGDYRKIPHGRVIWNAEHCKYYVNVIGLENTDWEYYFLGTAIGEEFHLESFFNNSTEPLTGEVANVRLMAFVYYGFSQILGKFFKNKDSNLMLFSEVDDMLKKTADEIKELLNRHFKDMKRYKELCPDRFKKYANIFKDI